MPNQISWGEFDTWVRRLAGEKASLEKTMLPSVAVRYHMSGEVLTFACNGFEAGSWEEVLSFISERAIVETRQLWYDNVSGNMPTTYNSMFLLYTFSNPCPPAQREASPLTKELLKAELLNSLPKWVAEHLRVSEVYAKLELPITKIFIRTRPARHNEYEWAFVTDWRREQAYRIEGEIKLVLSQDEFHAAVQTSVIVRIILNSDEEISFVNPLYPDRATRDLIIFESIRKNEYIRRYWWDEKEIETMLTNPGMTRTERNLLIKQLHKECGFTRREARREGFKRWYEANAARSEESWQKSGAYADRLALEHEADWQKYKNAFITTWKQNGAFLV